MVSALDLSIRSQLGAKALEPLDRKPSTTAQGPVPSQDSYTQGPTQGCTKVDSCGPPLSTRPCITEAILLIEETVYERRDTVTARRDPMIVSGTAVPGSKILLRNPDVKGWPVIAETEAGPDGQFKLVAKDERFLHRGDRAYVVAEEPGKRPSEGVLVDTRTITEITRIKEHFHDGVLRNHEERVERFAHEPHADDSAPYYDADEVSASVLKCPGGGDKLRLSGRAHAVPPGTTITLAGGNKSAQTTAANDGSFSLEVESFRPGSALSLEIKDPNGRITRTPILAPTMEIAVAPLVAGTRWDGQALQVRTGPAFGRDDVVVVRNATTGATHRLEPTAHGTLDARIEGVEPFHVLEFGLATGDRKSNRIQSLLVLPRESDRGVQKCTPSLLALDTWTASTPSLVPSLTRSLLEQGGTGCGTTLGIPVIDGLPPFGRVDVIRDGQVAYQLRADGSGVVPAVRLADVAAGERLSFQTFDGAGRRLGVDVPGWCAPSVGGGAKSPALQRRPENHTLGELADLVGSGELAVPDAGATIKVTTRLNPRDDRKFLGVAVPEQKGLPVEITGGPAEGLFAEAAGAGEFASVTLTVADWTTGTRNMVFERYDGRQTYSTAVRIPLAGTSPGTSPTDAPTKQACLDLLGRTVAFVTLARSVGQGPGDEAYDGPMRIARTLLYALDHMAQQAGEAEGSAIRKDTLRIVGGLDGDPVDAAGFVPSKSATPVTTRSGGSDFWASAPKPVGAPAMSWVETFLDARKAWDESFLSRGKSRT